jgi:hypothetical protein
MPSLTLQHPIDRKSQRSGLTVNVREENGAGNRKRRQSPEALRGKPEAEELRVNKVSSPPSLRPEMMVQKLPTCATSVRNDRHDPPTVS